jgi:bacillithiol biosynthesis cysteine-adding enzyme BshC
MEHLRIPYHQTGQFTPIVLDHLAGRRELRELVQFPSTDEGIRSAIDQRSFPAERRQLLKRVLERQYAGLQLHDAVRRNIDRLGENGTLTITTGHQVCLFTGPLYVPLKILNVVRLADQWSAYRPVVPIFWMATEDHDLAEVDHVFVHGKKSQWKGGGTGAVGRMLLKDIDPVLRELEAALGPGSNATQLKDLIEAAYRAERTLAEATRIFVNSIFGRFGIVCLDADDVELKREFLPAIRNELFEGLLHRSVAGTEQWLQKEYKVQAPSREINLFHLANDQRSRIIGGKTSWHTEAGQKWDRTSLNDELEKHPENFSPNVLMRPLYQETILPNIAYIGGGGELAYWLQLREVFKAFDLPMPVLLLRTSLGVLNDKDVRRLNKLDLDPIDLFRSEEDLHKILAEKHSGIDLSLEKERERIGQFYSALEARAGNIDHTLKASVAGAAARANRGLDHIEKKFLRAAKKRTLQQADALQAILEHFMPHGKLQERQENFMSFYCLYGEQFFDRIKDQLDPLRPEFNVFVEEAQ